MPTRIPIIRRGDMLLPATPQARDQVRELPSGQEMAADVVQVRNPRLHRLAFAYLQLAFDMWEPETFVSATERRTVDQLREFLGANGLPAETVDTLSDRFLAHLNARRADSHFSKSFEGFREFVTIEAGFFETIITPSGPRKVALSWAYKNMGNEKFMQLYNAIREVCWRLVLNQSYGSMLEADQAAEQLLYFD